MTELLLNGWTDLNAFFWMRLGDAPDNLDSQIIPLGPGDVLKQGFRDQRWKFLCINGCHGF